MQRMLTARQGGGGLTSEQTQQVKDFHGVVTNYLTIGLMPGLAAAGQGLGIRNVREMRTLAEALDSLLRGDLAHAGDLLM